MNYPVKKEPLHHGMTHSACQERLDKEGGKTRCCYCVPHEGCTLTSPRPDGWEERFDDKFIAVKKYYGADKPSVLANHLCLELGLPDKIKAFIRQELTSQHQKDIEAFRGMIEGMREPKQTALAIIYNEAIDDVLTALSTFASTDTGKENT